VNKKPKQAESHTDMVNRPAHYNNGDIEAIDAARSACVSDEAFREHCRMTAFGYVWRAPFKGSFDEDIRKAIWYLRQALGDDPRNDK
jgi:hypothetical protein